MTTTILDDTTAWKAVSFVLVLLLGSAAAASPAKDAWLTAKVKTALVMSEGVSSRPIDVDAFDAVVTLHGKVASDAERTRAASAAAEVEGVRGVRNLLAVVPEERRRKVEAADAQITEAVAGRLARDEELRDSAISVRSVNDGIVLLDGRAGSIEDHRRALADAEAVPEVRRVASAIHSPNARADAEIRAREGVASTEPPSGLRRAASDAWITSRAKLRLLGSLGLSPFKVTVDTRDGVVAVSGVVSSPALKRDAETLLLQVDGVRSVENYLQVVPEVASREESAATD